METRSCFVSMVVLQQSALLHCATMLASVCPTHELGADPMCSYARDM